MHAINRFNDDKDTESDQKEVYDVLEEIAVGDYGFIASSEEVMDFDF